MDYDLLLSAENGQLDIIKNAILYNRDELGVSRPSIDNIFMKAAEHGQLNIIEYFILNDLCNIHTICTAMNLASGFGHLNVVKCLSEHKDCTNRIKKLGLVSAVEENQLNIVEYFISQGIDVSAFQNYCIRTASRYGNFEILKRLVLAGAVITNVNYCVVSDAAIYGRMDILKFLMESDTKRNADYESILNNAIMQEKNDVVNYLVSQGIFSKQLDPCRYISVLDNRHLKWIQDTYIHKIVISRESQKRMNCNYYDTVIITMK